MKKQTAFNLRTHRKNKLGLTIEKIAARADVTASAVRQFECGLFRGTFLFKQKMADAYEVPLRDLLTAEELAFIEKFLEGERQVQISSPHTEKKRKK